LDDRGIRRHLLPRKDPGSNGTLERKKVDDMANALALFLGYTLLAANRKDENTKIPEPEFKPFRFPEKETAPRSLPTAPANVAREPRTLVELGIPASLAGEMEATFRAMDLTRGERVVGYTFVRRDGTRHALRLSEVPRRDAAGLAA
jgi:hypothetical protein